MTMRETGEKRVPSIPGEPESEKSTAQLRAEVEGTRREVAKDVEAISEKLTPEHLAQEAKEQVRSAAKHVAGRVQDKAEETWERVQDTAESAWETAVDSEAADFVRRNSVPLALLGVGAAWLVANQRRRAPRGAWRMPAPRSRHRLRGEAGYEGYGEYYGEPPEPSMRPRGSRAFMQDPMEVGQDTRGRAEEMGHRAAEMGQQVRERVEDVGHRVRERASEARERAQEMGHELRERAQDMGHQLRESAEEARHFAVERGKELRHRAEDTFEESPLTAGAVAAAVGAGIGFLLPLSRRERETMGPARDRLLATAAESADEAREAARDAFENTKRTAQRAAERVAESAVRHASDAAERHGFG
jgi:ElaB/YqjD/DUF883 family membrane-anchored ribosome-binding protein